MRLYTRALVLLLLIASSAFAIVDDKTGSGAYVYDVFGRVASETWVQGGVSQTTAYT